MSGREMVEEERRIKALSDYLAFIISRKQPSSPLSSVSDSNSSNFVDQQPWHANSLLVATLR